MHIFKRKDALSLGSRGEKSAKKYLEKCGYKILATNFFNPVGRRLGEIDIIAEDKGEIVFVEVKTRKFPANTLASLPEESITPSKLHKLNKIASFYLSKNSFQGKPYRFDAVTILADTENSCASLRHIKNIFI